MDLVIGEREVDHGVAVHTPLHNVGSGADRIQNQFQTKSSEHTLYTAQQATHAIIQPYIMRLYQYIHLHTAIHHAPISVHTFTYSHTSCTYISTYIYIQPYIMHLYQYIHLHTVIHHAPISVHTFTYSHTSCTYISTYIYIQPLHSPTPKAL